VANWYKRNLRIFANINRITEPGKDRILVIIGAGHLKLLKEFAGDAPYFDEVDAESFLK
jgi:pheromone shutdown protein TraB